MTTKPATGADAEHAYELADITIHDTLKAISYNVQCRTEWDGATRTYTLGDRTITLTTTIDHDGTSTGWDWALAIHDHIISTGAGTTAEHEAISHQLAAHLAMGRYSDGYKDGYSAAKSYYGPHARTRLQRIAEATTALQNRIAETGGRPPAELIRYFELVHTNTTET